MIVLGAQKRPLLVIFYSPHKGVRDQHPMMQVWRLAIGVTARGSAQLAKFFDLRMADGQINSC